VNILFLGGDPKFGSIHFRLGRGVLFGGRVTLISANLYSGK